MTPDRPPLPHDLEAEVGVLGSMLLNPGAAARCLDLLTADDFYFDTHGRTFRAIDAVLEDQGTIDVILVRERMKQDGVLDVVGGKAFLARLLASVPSFANAEHYARIVLKRAKERGLVEAADAYARVAIDGQAEPAFERVLRARDALATTRGETAPSKRMALPVASLRTVVNAPVEEPAWFVHGLLGRKRLTILTAAPKTGKSAASLGVAFRLASGMGGTWLGTDFGASIGLRVLYLSAEGGRRLIQTRYSLLAEGLPGGWEESFFLLTERPWPRLDTNAGLDALRVTLAEHPADLLVIDPLARFRDLEAENDNAAGQALADGLRAVAEDFDLAVLLIHHPSKASGLDRDATSFYGGRGASALFGEVDAAINLMKDHKSGHIHAHFELRDAEPIEPGRRLSLNPDTLWLDYEGPLGAISTGRKTSIDSPDVLRELRACPDGHPWAQVHKLLGVGRSSWFRERGRVFEELAGKIRLDGPVAHAEP